MEKAWKNKNPKIKCCNCIFDTMCTIKCTYLSIKKYNAMQRSERVKVGFGKSRPKPIELKRGKIWKRKFDIFT